MATPVTGAHTEPLEDARNRADPVGELAPRPLHPVGKQRRLVGVEPAVHDDSLGQVHEGAPRKKRSF